VTAWLLKQQGHEVVGIFMKNWEDDDDSEYCSSQQDFVDAAAVADVIGIEIEHVNFAADYKDRVFAEFLREYQAGRTPNPDVLCNAEIKFKAFLDHAMRLGAEKIATGHYAGVRKRDGRFELLKGLDPRQGPELLPAPPEPGAAGEGRCFRWASCPRPRCAASPRDRPAQREERRTPPASASSASGRSANSSTATCKAQPGPIKDERGRKIGEHVGLSFYTLGQRQGLGIGGVKDKGAARGGGEHAPWFVARKDMAPTRCVPCRGTTIPGCCRALLADDCQLDRRHAPADGAFAAKTRYRQADAACALSAGDAPGAFCLRLRRAAMGRDAGPERGAVRRRGLPGRRRDRAAPPSRPSTRRPAPGGRGARPAAPAPCAAASARGWPRRCGPRASRPWKAKRPAPPTGGHRRPGRE
jgi:tRNA-specific 2-thiouridylase